MDVEKVKERCVTRGTTDLNVYCDDDHSMRKRDPWLQQGPRQNPPASVLRIVELPSGGLIPSGSNQTESTESQQTVNGRKPVQVLDILKEPLTRRLPPSVCSKVQRHGERGGRGGQAWCLRHVPLHCLLSFATAREERRGMKRGL